MSTTYALVGESIACSHFSFGYFGILSHFMIEYSILLVISSSYGDVFSVGHLIVLLMSLVEMRSIEYLISLYPRCVSLYNKLFPSSPTGV